MARSDIRRILERVSLLGSEIERFVPIDAKTVQFRADLAGLLVVAMVAAYESCVKETLISFAAHHHSKYGEFAERKYGRLNSRIRLPDLYGYCRLHDRHVHEKFGKIIKRRKSRVMTFSGRDFPKDYEQILDWRHDFAHAGVNNTTVEEALATHRFARLMLHSFDDAFE